MTDDMTLLGEYARSNSEEAFAALVSRHVNLVYSVALRDVQDPHLAEEITQAVFVILARKAESLGPRVILSGWLCRTARYASANALTIQRRRQQREHEAYMQSTLNAPEPDAWTQIAPLLGGAMGRLGQKDHDTIVLRFFEGKSFQEIGAAFGASENAAKKRVAYALEKLRKYFSKSGVVLPATVIGVAISAHSVQAAPAVLTKTAIAVAIAKGATAPVSTLALIKGALKVMAWSSAKTAMLASAAVLLAAGSGAAIYETQSNPTTGNPVELKVKWAIGKRYELHGETVQSSKTKSPGQAKPVDGGLKWTEDLMVSVPKELPTGGWQLEMEFLDEAIEDTEAGHSVGSFDSSQSQSVDKNNPWSILAALIGRRIDYFTDAEGKVKTIDGMKPLTDHVAAVGTTGQRSIFYDLFGGDQLKDYLSSGSWLPNRIMNVGEGWSVTNDAATASGVVTVTMNYTFKKWEHYGDHSCARIEGTGDLATKSISTVSGEVDQIQKGKIVETFWFDPKLRMVTAGNEDEDWTIKISTRTQTEMKEAHTRSVWTLMDAQ